MSKEGDPVFEYITALEGVNDQMVVTLRFCIELLTEFKDMVPDPEGWQDMLDTFALTLHEAETSRELKTFH